MRRHARAVLATLVLLPTGCASRAARVARAPEPAALPRIDYSVQVGAFALPENAARLIEALGSGGLEAFSFVSDDGIYKVRFGSFPSREHAVRRAEALRAAGVIDDYFVVTPAPGGAARGDADLRAEIARSAMGFLGRPYRWGGSSPESGLDCSGLTMAAYRLNGLALPRASAAQFANGEPVSRSRLRRADLVFFATESRRKPTHVGLYLGEGRFIHAPSSGGVVRVDELEGGYYERRYLGGRSYLSR